MHVCYFRNELTLCADYIYEHYGNFENMGVNRLCCVLFHI